VTRPAVLAGLGALLLFVAAGIGWQPVPAGSNPGASHPVPSLDGAELFRVKGCTACHTGPDSEAVISGPPNLSDAREWAGHRVRGLSAAQYISQSIRDPGAFTSPAFTPNGPLVAMPTLVVTGAEVAALVRYLLAR
jgi:cytochrome c551/c552